MSKSGSALEVPIFVKLQSSDGVLHTVDIRLALQFAAIRDIAKVENGTYSNDVIPLARVDSKTMEFIIKWYTFVQDIGGCEQTTGMQVLKGLLKNQNAEPLFLVQLLLASDYLGLDIFLEAGTKLLANVINSCQSTEEIRRRFNVETDH
ncbi:uncharacterized protein LOC108145806 [Drosophila elegans]|uniref:uncharacterized protein LOC108145806 n=1 Tax=Drosophila elegans TaxID=30023 RepID=UPI0007E69CFC|nr:uncharacterized protein LOC108145806 [Drosophila elegans]